MVKDVIFFPTGLISRNMHHPHTHSPSKSEVEIKDKILKANLSLVPAIQNLGLLGSWLKDKLQPKGTEGILSPEWIRFWTLAFTCKKEKLVRGSFRGGKEPHVMHRSISMQVE